MRLSLRARASREQDAAISSESAPQSVPVIEDTAAFSGRDAHTKAGTILNAQRLPLMLLVFVAGIASLSLEMCAPRLLAPYFGTSLLVWANVIGLFLLYLSVGYFFGGRLADRYPSTRLLCALTAIAGIATCIIPFISEPVLQLSVRGLATANVSVLYSSLLAVILLFLLPMTLLGFVSPFAVRLFTARVGSAGRSAGSLYALSTAGSIIGAFLPVLVLIPDIGVRRTLLATGVALMLIALWGLRLPVRIATAAPLVVMLVPLLLPQVAPLGPLKSDPGLIYSEESFYNYIQVVQQRDGTRQLVLNEGQAIHSVYNPNETLTGWYWDYFLSAPYFNSGATAGKVHRVAIIGLAAGTIARQFTQVYGPVPIDGVEIDPAIVSVGQRYFAMNEPNLHVYDADGRTFIRVTHQTYDVVAIDAFQQPYIPFQLTTKEFFEEIRSHLSPNGVICLNTGHTRTDYRLVQAFVNTLSQVFPSVYTFNVPGTFNTEVMATMRPTSITTFRNNLQQMDPTSVMSVVAAEVLPVVQVAHPQRGGIVFTDDRAPIEELTDQLLFSYAQQGG